ncbi:MAG: crossover junction endodeoxyribonuclease RuvC [Desulfobacterales bacterium]|nr:crossover junction endodeoxyribonuclease RuvC [Desulfobacterales bacterium]MBF0397741.1 crossover junction endodeoxyribonuclease RuvC [Desulfobacterales bacterium]
MVKIVGIDPGLAETGVAIIKGKGSKVFGFAYGSIQTSKDTPLPTRLEQIFTNLNSLLKNEKPDLIIVEDIFSLKKYPKSAIMLGKVTGVILLAGSISHIPVTEVAVREAKCALTGNGNASKMQLEKSVRQFLNLDVQIKPYHASDAIALALTGLFREGLIS